MAEVDYRPLMTGAGIEIVHALAALVALTLLPGRWALATAWSFILGSTLFAGAIDARIFGGLHLGPTAPTGGIVLMIGWLVLAVGTAKTVR